MKSMRIIALLLPLCTGISLFGSLGIASSRRRPRAEERQPSELDISLDLPLIVSYSDHIFVHGQKYIRRSVRSHQQDVNISGFVSRDVIKYDILVVYGILFYKEVTQESQADAQNKQTESSKDEQKKDEPSFFSRTYSKLEDGVKTGLEFVDRQPKKAAVIGGTCAALAIAGAYEGSPKFQKRVHRRIEELQGTASLTYYDMMMNHVAPAYYRWQELREKPLTQADVAKGCMALGGIYALKKTNDLLGVTSYVTKGLGLGKRSVLALKNYGKDYWNSLLQDKAKATRLVLAGAGLAALIACYRYFSAVPVPHRALLADFWQTFSPEQVEILKTPACIDLVVNADSDPSVLLKNQDFIDMLTPEQFEKLLVIVRKGEKYRKRMSALV